MTIDPKIDPTPEQIDELELELAMMGVHVPPRDTAFFQANVRRWLARLIEPKSSNTRNIEQCPDCGVTDNLHLSGCSHE